MSWRRSGRSTRLMILTWSNRPKAGSLIAASSGPVDHHINDATHELGVGHFSQRVLAALLAHTCGKGRVGRKACHSSIEGGRVVQRDGDSVLSIVEISRQRVYAGENVGLAHQHARNGRDVA